jgi:hypothetical protein
MYPAHRERYDLLHRIAVKNGIIGLTVMAEPANNSAITLLLRLKIPNLPRLLIKIEC